MRVCGCVCVCVDSMGACKLEREREQVGAVKEPVELEPGDGNFSLTPVAEPADAVTTFQLYVTFGFGVSDQYLLLCVTFQRSELHHY